MKFKIKYADKVVGIFIIIGLLSVSVLLIFMGINQRWFATNYSYHTRFLSADGLRVGMPIRYKGFQIGQIRRVRLGSENDVEVDFYIYGEYIDIITPNTIIQKITSPIGLGSDIIIHPGRASTERIPENSFIPSFNTPEARALIDAGLVEITAPDGLMEQINPVLSDLTALLNSLNRTLEGEETLAAGQIVKNIEEITSEVSSNIENILTDVENIIKNINTFSTSLSDPNNTLTAILRDDSEIYEHIDEILSNLNNTMIGISDFISFINNSRPQITGVLEESRGALREGTAVMEGLRNNPLLRRGITQQREQVSAQHSIRKEEF
ncbi:MAG: MlaD family protein [Spirochaetaceae bacterium]|nr:MlaD family protein [Spirochaetaceae bacterium]